VQRFHYWQLRLHQVRNHPISPNQLLYYQREGAISEIETSYRHEQDIKKAQQEAYQNLKTLQKNHQELRDTYLEDLAEAIVLDRSPNLADEALTPIRAERSEKQLKQLISREKLCRMYRKIGRALNKLSGKGLSQMDIPDVSAVTEGSGDPDDPKTWKGPWKSVTNPTEIAREVCKVNARQYHQAHSTPFGSGPLADLFGRRGDTPSAEILLQGSAPATLPSSTMPETIRVLQSLASPVHAVTGSAVISPDEFRSSYRIAKEGTSSFPSGRHIGHYEAVLKDPSLVQLHSQMMSIPFQVGFAPQRWMKVTDIMLEKEANNPRCHQSRILALFESDLNHAKMIIIGRQLLHHMNDHEMLPPMQHGSVPGKHCLSGVLKKVLSHDHLWLTKLSGAFIENDAVGCYDRLVNNLVLMLMVKLGLPKSVVACIGDLWDSVVHMIKTMYGISTVSYGSTAAQPLYGPDQGSTCGQLFWLLCYWVIVKSLDPTITAAKFVSACRDIIVEITGVLFIDDSSLSVTSEYVNDHNLTDEANRSKEVEHLVARLTALSQHWERLLFTTGGAINFQKSHWYLMTWLWKNGLPHLATARQSPAHMVLTTGYHRIQDVVPHIEPSEGFCTLGGYLTPSGNYSKQAKVLRGYAETFREQLFSSTLTPTEAYCCLMLYIRPKITYPFPCVSLTENQCRHIQAPILEAILPKLHLNRHSPRAVLFAGPRYGGLNLAENYSDLGYGHLQYMVGHLKLGDEVGQLIISLITHTQLNVGSCTPFFQLAFPSYEKWIDHTWVTDVWKFAHRAGIIIEVENQWTPKLLWHSDVLLMDLAMTFNFNAFQLRCINICRLYLQVIMLSQRNPHQRSSLLWPNIPRPSQSFWQHWRILLQHISRGNRLLQPLGSWINKPH
jgi:hypothetical protein